MNALVVNSQEHLFDYQDSCDSIDAITRNDSLANSAVLAAIEKCPQFMTVKQVAEVLQMSQNTIRSLLNQQLLPGKKLSHKWVVPREALAQALIES